MVWIIDSLTVLVIVGGGGCYVLRAELNAYISAWIHCASRVVAYIEAIFKT